MATKVYEVKEIELQDGTVIEQRPLVISKLREFMDKFKTLGDLADDDDPTEVMVDLARICIAKKYPELAADKNRDELTDSLDMPTIHEIIRVGTGINLASPELLEAATAAALAEEPGRN